MDRGVTNKMIPKIMFSKINSSGLNIELALSSVFLKQEAVTTACTRGFNIFAKFCCRQTANFCSHLLASSVHFTVVLKSQAIFIIRLEAAEVIYHSSWGRRSYFRRICSGTTILRVDSAYRSLLWQQRCVCIM